MLEQDNNSELKLAELSNTSGTTTAAVHQLTSIDRTVVSSGDERIDSSSTQETDASGSVAIDIENNNDALVSASPIPECDETTRGTTINHESYSISTDQVASSTAVAVEDTRESYNCSQGQLVLSTVTMTSVADGRGMTTENMNVGQTGINTIVEDDTSVGYRTAIKHQARKVLLSPNIIAVFSGIVISLIPPLQDMLFNNTQAALWPLGAALHVSAVSIFVIAL